MKHYAIKVSAPLPYLIHKDYRVEASNWHTAVSRAVKLYVADIRKAKGRKRIPEMTVKAYVIKDPKLEWKEEA